MVERAALSVIKIVLPGYLLPFAQPQTVLYFPCLTKRDKRANQILLSGTYALLSMTRVSM